MSKKILLYLVTKTQEKNVNLIKKDFSFINQGCNQKIKDNGSSA